MRSKLVDHFFNKKDKNISNTEHKTIDNKKVVAKKELVVDKKESEKKITNEWYNKYKKQVLKQTLNNKQAMLRQYYAERYDTVSIKNNTILYEVRDGTSFTDSPRSLFNYMIKNEKYKNFTHVIVYDQDHLDAFPVSYLEIFSNVKLVERDTFEYMDWLLCANYLVTNSTFRSSFLKKEDQVYINTWHGTPLKHMGDAYEYDPTNASNVRRNFLLTDYLLSPNEYTTRIFLEDYKLNGVWQGKILENGLPRNDLQQYDSRETILNKLLIDGLEIDTEKKNIVYMPTWTGTDVNDANDVSKQLNSLLQIVNDKLGDNINFLIKVHPFLFDIVKKDEHLKKYLVSNHYDSNEIFKITDCLITDFSSVFFDFLVTNRPIIFYNWNAEIYNQNRGNYLSDDQLPGPSAKNIQELLTYMSDISKVSLEYKTIYEKAQKAFVNNEDSNMISEYIETIFDNKKDLLKVVKPQKGKIKLLIHPGALYDNGITTSFLNLVNQIDYSKYDVTAFLHESKDLEVIKNFRKINKNVRKIFKPGLPIYTLEENIRDRYLKNDIPDKQVDQNLFPEKGYMREADRLFSKISFDAVIDFSGYSYFWAKYLVVNKAPVKVAYMHNDLWAETNRQVDGKFPLRNDLFGIFSLYSKFTKLVSVSKALQDINNEKLVDFVDESQMTFVENSIDLNKIFSKSGNTENELVIQEANSQLFFDNQLSSIKLYRKLDDIFAELFYMKDVKFSSSYTSAFSVSYGDETYQYVLEDNVPLGWMTLSNKPSYFDAHITYNMINGSGYTSQRLETAYANLDDLVLGYETECDFEKYELLKISQCVTINGKEYFEASSNKHQIVFIPAQFINIVSIQNVSGKKFAKYTPNEFTEFLPYVKVNTKENITVYKDKTLKKKRIQKLPTDIFFFVENVQFKNSKCYYLISESNRLIGWTSQDNLSNINLYLPNEYFEKQNGPVLKPLFVNQTQDIPLYDELGNFIKSISRDNFKWLSFLDKKILNGKTYLQVLYKLHSYYVSLTDVNLNKNIFKNVCVKDNENCVHGFIVSYELMNDKNVYSVLVGNEIRSYEKQNIEHLNDNIPLMIDLIKNELFVTLKKGDIVWKAPYDNTAVNEKVASTGMLNDYVFKTIYETRNYKNSVFVGLSYKNQFIGWVNKRNVEIAAYQDYLVSEKLDLPVDTTLIYFEKEPVDNNIFENDYSLVSTPDELVINNKHRKVNKEKEHFIDGELVINKTIVWKRLIEGNKILGYLKWKPYYDRLVENNSTTRLNMEESGFYISSKKTNAEIVFKHHINVKTYDSVDDIDNNNYYEMDFDNKNYYIDEVASFKGDKFVRLNGQKNNRFVNVKDIEIVNSHYLEALPDEFRSKISVLDTVFVTMGRLSPEKNQSSLIKAISILVKKGYDLKLLILGKGPLKEELERLIKEFNLENHVFLVGQLENPFVTVSESDLFVFPSYWEGQPMVLLEALALNKKIISSNIPQSKFVLKDGKYGLVADGVDDQAMSDAMEKVLTTETNFKTFDYKKYNMNALQQFYDMVE